MRKIMCFIGNQQYVSKNMMQSLYLYSKDNNRDLNADFVVVTINDEYRERFLIGEDRAKPYKINSEKKTFSNIPFLQIEVQIESSDVAGKTKELLEDIKKEMGAGLEDKLFFIMDHNAFYRTDNLLLKENKCPISMMLHKNIIRQHKCVLCTSCYYDVMSKTKWQDIYLSFFKDSKIPVMFEREQLYMSYFHVKTAKEIIDTFLEK